MNAYPELAAEPSPPEHFQPSGTIGSRAVSGKFSIVRIIFALLCSTMTVPVLSIALAVCSKFLYLILVMPALAGWLLTIPMSYLLRAGHCRDPRLAGVTAVVGAAAMYLGQFHALLVLDSGTSLLPRLDLLPAFVVANVNNWQMSMIPVAIAAPEIPGASGATMPVINWLVFLTEITFAVSVATLLTVADSGRGYCERCSRWMTRKIVRLTPGSAHNIVTGLTCGTLDLVPEITTARMMQRDFDTLVLEGCSHGGHSSIPGTFLIGASETRRDDKQLSHRNLLVQAPLSLDEFLALVRKCPLRSRDPESEF